MQAYCAAVYMQIWIIGKYYVILYKGIKHSWILVCAEGPKTNLLHYQGTAFEWNK